MVTIVLGALDEVFICFFLHRNKVLVKLESLFTRKRILYRRIQDANELDRMTFEVCNRRGNAKISHDRLQIFAMAMDKGLCMFRRSNNSMTRIDYHFSFYQTRNLSHESTSILVGEE